MGGNVTDAGDRNGPDIEALLRARDWSRSPFGAPSTWPASLKAAFGLLLPARAQIVLFWGPDYVALYNDAYAPTIGDKHPRALGRPAVENWTELWDDLEPLLRRVRETGQPVRGRCQCQRESSASGSVAGGGVLTRLMPSPPPVWLAAVPSAARQRATG